MNPFSSNAVLRRHYCELVVRGSERKALSVRGAKSALRIKTPDVIRQEIHRDKLHCSAMQSEILAFGLRVRALGGGNSNVEEERSL